MPLRRPTTIECPRVLTVSPNLTLGVDKDSEPVDVLALDDAALQLYKDGDYGSYLDLEASISEQQEEFEGFELKDFVIFDGGCNNRTNDLVFKVLDTPGYPIGLHPKYS
ncbi:hypothetical protein GWI33_020722 [Rhynchophorus ferrugineus]|uniref:FHOD1 N-terminal GTPase-binding domain-containing protein n=1 Tax=Rhynchophorus ferrugineus TaxID=354439 RepID=A0A834HQK4_RHYFE|nr:hypothetical protein GWI33_020722 [Rhynchophorus ferrugineus]